MGKPAQPRRDSNRVPAAGSRQPLCLSLTSPRHKHNAAGNCNSAATIAAVAQLRADIIARSSSTTLIEIYCVDAPATGRRLLSTSTLYGWVCPNDPNFLLPQPAIKDAAKLAGQCSLSYAVSDQPSRPVNTPSTL